MNPISTRIVLAAALLACTCVHAVTCGPTGVATVNPDAIYAVHGNGTVTDTRTNLMWKQCLEGQNEANCTGSPTTMNWVSALAQAEASTFAGYSDWRLPNEKELRSLVEECRQSPAINDAIFLNMPSNSYAWSSSPSVGGGAVSSLLVNFSTGNATHGVRTAPASVRLVRDRDVGPLFRNGFEN